MSAKVNVPTCLGPFTGSHMYRRNDCCGDAPPSRGLSSEATAPSRVSDQPFKDAAELHGTAPD